MLYELFIDGRQVDLSDNISIPLNYTSIDTDTPTAEHGSYSKSVELKGTETNNNIFGSIYRLDRHILDGGGYVSGSNFDAKKRTDYVLWYNGEVVDRGYIKLDSVKRKNYDEIEYSITLYSDLGDFFYNLMYNKDDGEELSLADLHYGFTGIDEDTDTLFYWDKDYIYDSWQMLGTPVSDLDIKRHITAAPVYGGYYDDFDNDTVLVNYDSLPSGGVARDILSPIFPDPSAPSTYHGWLICKGTRDFDEWEMRDLRSVNQVPAVRFSTILDAISNPENNGGYEVIWDDEIKNSAYYQDTWLILNRLNFDLDEAANTSHELSIDYGRQPIWVKQFYNIPLTDFGTATFDLSSMDSPRVTVTSNAVLDFDVFTDSIGTGKTLYTCYHPKIMSNMGYTHVFNPYYYGGQAYRISVYKDGQLIKQTPTYLLATDTYKSDKSFGYGVPDWREQIATKIGVDPASIVVNRNTLKWDDSGRQYTWVNPISIDIDLPQDTGISLSLDTCWVWASSTSLFPDGGVAVPNGDNVLMYNYAWFETVLVNSDTENSGIYDGTINPNIQKTNVTKSILFGESESPYKYLVGFTRAIGAKFRYDLGAKKIYINTRRNYYLPEGHIVDGQIDRNEGIEIEPTLCEYKWYKYGFETPETYASGLYKRKNKSEYGEVKVDTSYYFNNDENDLFSDIPYTNAIPYLENSIYYSVYSGVPSILVSPTLDVTNFSSQGGVIEGEDTKIKGYASFHNVNSLKDSSGNKICAFDSDNGYVDSITNCLVFYDGKRTMVDDYQISDNIPIMQTLNEGTCYLYVSGGTAPYVSKDSPATVEVCKLVKDIPVFSKYKTVNDVYTDSLDFVKPNYTFIDNYENYANGITLYDRYWRTYIDDLYHTDNKAVTVHMFLRENPDIAMRKFYYFDNSIWVISEITDYCANSEKPTQIKFVKVSDTTNYTDNAVVFDDMYDYRHSGTEEYEYRWVLTETTTCVGFDMYYLYSKQSRVLNGTEWSDTGEYSVDANGTMPMRLKEKDCFDCGYVAYRWVLSDDTTCVGFDKYGLYKEQYMSGSTQVWRDIVPEVTSIDADGTEEPVLIEINSTDCGYVPYEYQWRLSQEYVCSGCDKYLLYIKQQRPVGETEWEDVVPEVSSIDAEGTMPVSVTTCSTDCSPSAGTVGILTNNWTNDCFCDGGIPAKFYSGRTDLQVVDVHSTITSLGDRAFEGCTNLRQIILKGSGTWYGHLCMGCTSLTAVTIIGNYTVIQGWAFRNCTSLTSITIPDSITLIGGYSFEGCTNLQSVTLGSGLTQLNVNMFNNCTSLSSITVNAPTAPTLGENVFRNISPTGVLHYPCGSDYSSWFAALPSGWTDPCHEYRWQLMTDGTVTCSGSSAYTPYIYQVRTVGITDWEDVVPERISIDGAGTKPKVLKSSCSSNCGYASADFYNSANTIFRTECFANGYLTFEGRSKSDVYYLHDNTYKIVVKEPMRVIDNSLSSFGVVSSITLPNTITNMGVSGLPSGAGTFQWNRQLKVINIPSGVTTIVDKTFKFCDSLPSVTIPNTVTSIGASAFDACISLTSITIPDSVTSIGNGAFQDCEKLSSVTIPDSVVSIGANAFRHNYNYNYGTALTSVTIGSGVTSIGEGAFQDCWRLLSVTIPDSVVSIGARAFANKSPYGVPDLKSVVIGSGVTTIGEEAFYGNHKLTSVTMPDTITSIGASAFQNCLALTSITIPNLTIIEDNTFANCNNLTSVTIPDTVTSIGASGFTSCDSLTSVTIGSGVTSIGDGGFRACSNLSTITCYARTAPTLGLGALYATKSTGILRVPTGSNYSSWLTALNYSGSSSRNWTIQYI